MQKVLCVCLGNISRSPMMEALLQRALGPGWRVESAGVRKGLAGRPANEHSLACMRERGLDLAAHVSRWTGDLDLAAYRWIVCATPYEARQIRAALDGREAPDASWPEVIVVNAAGGGAPDPYGHGPEAYERCAALLDREIPEIARRIDGAPPA